MLKLGIEFILELRPLFPLTRVKSLEEIVLSVKAEK